MFEIIEKDEDSGTIIKVFGVGGAGVIIVKRTNTPPAFPGPASCRNCARRC